jgi:hypothetical protein
VAFCQIAALDLERMEGQMVKHVVWYEPQNVPLLRECRDWLDQRSQGRLPFIEIQLPDLVLIR